MKLWLLNRIGNTSYDEARGFVVRAETCNAARRIASSRSRGEGPEPWIDKKFSTCEEVTGEGSFGIILEDIYEG